MASLNLICKRALRQANQQVRPAIRCYATAKSPFGVPAVNPYKEAIGPNPADKTKELQGPLHEFGAYITACVPKFIQQFSVYKDELTLYCPPQSVSHLITFLRDHTNARFTQVMDVSGADYPSRSKRFEVVYHMLSIPHNSRIRVKTYADEVSPVPSIVPLFGGADWYEREIWDLFGVFFSGHPDLRRILTDYGFEGHPLRKDFPLTGYVEVRYDEEKKRVVQEPLQLSQAFRDLSGAASPWEQVGPGVDMRPETFKLPPAEPAKEEPKK